MATETKREVVIKHGLFWYHASELAVINGEEKEILVQKLAFHGERVELTRAVDSERGDKIGAFYSDEELQNLGHVPAESAADQEGESADLSDLDDDELVDWLMSTGEFDGHKKPTAAEVVAAVGDDKELAARVLGAEDTASGNEPRKSVVEPLTEVIGE